MYVINENSQAITHWNITTNKAYLLPSSCLMETIVAMHGTYNKQNTNKEIAELIDKNEVIAIPGSSTCKVETTDSFARNPDTSATTTRQSLKPHGLNIGAILLAIIAIIDSSGLFTIDSLNEKLCKNQMMIVATKMTVNALCKKSFALSHNNCPTDLALGNLYDGSSIINGIGSPLKYVLLNI